MNMQGVGMGPGVSMQMGGVPGGIMQQVSVSPQQMQVQQQQAMQAQPQQAMQAQPQQPLEKLDNISKVKSLVGPLRESLAATLKSAAQVLHQNHLVDVGSQKALTSPTSRFDKTMEEFYSICDQIELHLKTSIACLQQASWASQQLPLNVMAARTDPAPPASPPLSPALTYPQFLNTARQQVAYAKEIHDTLIAAAQKISPNE